MRGFGTDTFLGAMELFFSHAVTFSVLFLIWSHNDVPLNVIMNWTWSCRDLLFFFGFLSFYYATVSTCTHERKIGTRSHHLQTSIFCSFISSCSNISASISYIGIPRAVLALHPFRKLALCHYSDVLVEVAKMMNRFFLAAHEGSSA